MYWAYFSYKGETGQCLHPAVREERGLILKKEEAKISGVREAVNVRREMLNAVKRGSGTFEPE